MREKHSSIQAALSDSRLTSLDLDAFTLVWDAFTLVVAGGEARGGGGGRRGIGARDPYRLVTHIYHQSILHNHPLSNLSSGMIMPTPLIQRGNTILSQDRIALK